MHKQIPGRDVDDTALVAGHEKVQQAVGQENGPKVIDASYGFEPILGHGLFGSG